MGAGVGQAAFTAGDADRETVTGDPYRPANLDRCIRPEMPTVLAGRQEIA
jgi:hypothetical protein